MVKRKKIAFNLNAITFLKFSCEVWTSMVKVLWSVGL